MQNKRPILITGIERSGATIITKIITSCRTTEIIGSTTNMLENRGINESIGKLYSRLGCDPSGQYDLPNTTILGRYSEWKEIVSSTLSKEYAYRGNANHFIYKSSKICQTWPMWKVSYPNAKWVIVRRRTGDIIQSCLKTGYMKAYSHKEGWLQWVHQHESRFIEMTEAGIDYRFVWPEKMVYGDYTEIFSMLDWLELKYDINEIEKMTAPLFVNFSLKERGV